MRLSQQECWKELPIPTPVDLPHPEIKFRYFVSPALADAFFITSTTWEAPVWLPKKLYRQRSLAGYSLWGCKRVRHNLATNQYLVLGDTLVRKIEMAIVLQVS